MATATEIQKPNGPVAAPKKPQTLKGWLESDDMRNAVAQALPKHLTADRFLRVAITALTRTPKLANCDQASFFGCLLTLSQLGLEPDGRRAHLIPFENRKRNVTECQLIIDYKGLVELVLRSGVVSHVHADTICENDEFSYDKGEIQVHKIDFKRPRGNVYAVYSLCRFKDGTEACAVMTSDEVESIRKRSRAGTSGPWVTDWSEMAKKTVFRRLSKWLPFSAEIREQIEKDDDQYTTIEATTVRGPLIGSRSDQLAAMLSAPEEASGEESQVADREPGDDESQGEPQGKGSQETGMGSAAQHFMDRAASIKAAKGLIALELEVRTAASEDKINGDEYEELAGFISHRIKALESEAK